MVWTVAEFQRETSLGFFSKRNERVLLDIDVALGAFHALPRRAANNLVRARLVALQTAIEAWLDAKRRKQKSQRRVAVLELLNQVLPEIDRVERAIQQAGLVVVQQLPPPPPPPQLPDLLLDDDSGRYYYHQPETGEVRWAATEDWEILTDRGSGRRYYNNTVAQRTFWVEPQHWDVLTEEDGRHRTYYFDRVRRVALWERPPELTDERIAERDIAHMVRATRWVPEDYYTIEEAVDRTPAAATMTPYRKSLAELNTIKDKLDPKVRRVLLGDTLHLVIREDIQTARLTTGPYTMRSKAPVDLAQIDAWEGARRANGENLRIAQTMARQAVVLARRFLPLGAFNNRGAVQPPPATWSTHPGRDMQRLEEIAQALLGRSGDFLHAFACNGAAARSLGGGVCSMIGAMTAGLLTVLAKPETEIICCSHTADHTFCVLSHRKSPWVCADPWPLVSYPCRWAGSYFEPTANNPLNYYLKIDVHLPVKVPFGLAATPSHSLEPNAVAVVRDECPGGPGEIGSPYGHLSNSAGNDAPPRFDGVEPAVGQRHWGPAADVSAVLPFLV